MAKYGLFCHNIFLIRIKNKNFAIHVTVRHPLLGIRILVVLSQSPMNEMHRAIFRSGKYKAWKENVICKQFKQGLARYLRTKFKQFIISLYYTLTHPSAWWILCGKETLVPSTEQAGGLQSSSYNNRCCERLLQDRSLLFWGRNHRKRERFLQLNRDGCTTNQNSRILKQQVFQLGDILLVNWVRTLLDAKYSIPLATWYENETRSFCVSVLLSFKSSMGDSYLSIK